jgi:hypothetical protein
MANGNTIYNGPSEINGQSIKGIITGTKTKSDNTKTGDMAQLWLMFAGERPTDAAKSGNDESVCGKCPHRPLLVAKAKAEGQTDVKKLCYVNLGQAPNGVYKATYPESTPTINKPLRLGAYGEPTSVPIEIIRQAVNNAQGHTGYTHQWKETRFAEFKEICMASVDSEEEQIEAQSQGWRTYRVRKPGEALMPGEINCPASKESGYRTNCAKCQLCSGTSRQAKHISIIEH